MLKDIIDEIASCFIFVFSGLLPIVLVCFFSFLLGGCLAEIDPYVHEIEYKDKIIERELGKNFESYEDYLVYRIEIGE